MHSIAVGLGGVGIRLESEDRAFCAEFVSLFGDSPAPEPIRLHASLRFETSRDLGRLTVDDGEVVDGAGFLLGFSSDVVPLSRSEQPLPGIAPHEGWTTLALGGEAAFGFRGNECRFRPRGRWRRVLSHYLFLRMIRLRPEALFLHAASVGIAGRGVLLVGPKGSGKSTLAISLRLGGHALLGDETACYADGRLWPMRRPVTVKPGPRHAAVSEILARHGPEADADGVRRVPIDAFCGADSAVGPLPLRDIVFLKGFAGAPRLAPIAADVHLVADLQPLATSLEADRRGRRILDMMRLVQTTRCHALTCGAPEETAALVERSLGA